MEGQHRIAAVHLNTNFAAGGFGQGEGYVEPYIPYIRTFLLD